MTIVLAVICCGAACALFLMVAPFILTTRFSCMRNNLSGTFLLHWMHPRVALVKYTAGGATELRLFGWTMTIPGTQKTVGPEDSPPSREAVEKKTGKEVTRTFDDKSGQSPALPHSPTAPRSSDTAAGRSVPPMPDIEKPENAPVRNRLTWSKAKKTIAILRRGRAVPKIFRWCGRLLGLSLRIVRFDHLRIHAAAGAPDPADTGKIYGYFTALRAALFGNRKNIDISLEPRFTDTVLEFEGSIGLKTSIAAIILPAVVALVTFPYITVFFVWRRLKKVL